MLKQSRGHHFHKDHRCYNPHLSSQAVPFCLACVCQTLQLVELLLSCLVFILQKVEGGRFVSFSCVAYMERQTDM